MNKIKNHDDCDHSMSMIDDPKHMETYIKLNSARILFLSEDITKKSISDLTAMLFFLDGKSPGEDINLYINSNGGDSSALIQYLNVVKRIKSPINTFNIGKAYSAAAIILAAGGRRFAFKNSSVMIHGIQCLFPHMNELDQEGSGNYYDFLESHNDTIMKELAKYTKKPLAKLKADCSSDLYLTAPQALKYGIIDHIL